MSKYQKIEHFELHEKEALEKMGVFSSMPIQKIRHDDLFGFEFSNIANYPRRVLYDQTLKKRVELAQEKGTGALPVLLGPIQSQSDVICTEGETDMLALSNFTSNILSICGVTNTNLSKHKDILKSHFRGTETFSIIFDNDEPGRKGADNLKKELFSVFPDCSVRIVDISILSNEVKDIREGLSLKAAFSYEQLVELIKNTPVINKQSSLLEKIASDRSNKPKLPIAYSTEDLTLTFSLASKENSETILLISGGRDGQKNLTEINSNLLNQSYENEKIDDVPILRGINPTTLKDRWCDKQCSTTLFKKILSTFVMRIYCRNPSYHIVHAAYVFLTYIYPIFPVVPFLHFQGNKHCGKSQLSQIFELFAFNAELSTASTMASMRRILHYDRGTLILDDWERDYGSDQGEELISMLNSSYYTKSKSNLVNPDGLKPISMYIGGPKIFNSINKLNPILGSRCIIEKMLPAPIEFKIGSLPTKEETSNLRSMLALWALENHEKVRCIYNTGPSANNREDEIFKPLLSIVESIFTVDSKEYQSILEIKGLHKEMQAEKMTLNDIILDEVYQLWSEKGQPNTFNIPNSELVNDLKGRSDLPSHFHSNKIQDALKTYNILLGTIRPRDRFNQRITIYEINVAAMRSAWNRLSKSPVQPLNNSSDIST